MFHKLAHDVSVGFWPSRSRLSMTSVVLDAGELSGVMYRSTSKLASLEYPCTAVRACLIDRALYILGCADLT